jgi:signal transduction histidine kinase
MAGPRNPWLLAPGAALAAGAAFVALESPGQARVIEAALACVGVLLVWAVAMAERHRNPQRPMWLLLCALSVGAAVQPLASSPNALLFTLARAARPGVEVLLVWVMVAFPTGRLTTRTDRALVLAAAAAVLLLWLPGVMFSPRIALPGPFVTCGAGCPENLLFVADRPQWAATLLAAFRTTGVVLFVLVSAHLIRRLHRASALMRRALAPVLLASIARLLSIAAFLLSGGGGTLAMTVTFWAVPLAIALGLLRGRLYTARVLHALVTGLRQRPDAAELRNVMAEALNDPSLRVAYWSAHDSTWVDGSGHAVALPPAADQALSTRLLRNAESRPVAALVHDPALLEEPTLLDAVCSTMLSAMLANQAQAALLRERGRSAQAAAQERQRIERDLHDGAQQRLLALRMKLSVSRRLLDQDTKRADTLLREMDADIDAAIAEMRAMAHGLTPPLLAERGLYAALTDAAARSPLPVQLQLQEVGRRAPEIERAIYFSCVEALQNAAKHAGPGARVRLTLRADAVAIEFCVEDSGPGLGNAAAATTQGQGLANIRARLAAVGGRCMFGEPGPTGMSIRGVVPVEASGLGNHAPA